MPSYDAWWTGLEQEAALVKPLGPVRVAGSQVVSCDPVNARGQRASSGRWRGGRPRSFCFCVCPGWGGSAIYGRRAAMRTCGPLREMPAAGTRVCTSVT